MALKKHLHIFSTSLVVYYVESIESKMDWEYFFKEILPKSGDKTKPIKGVTIKVNAGTGSSIRS